MSKRNGRDAQGASVWAAWARDLGVQVRGLRQFVGLSQDELARLAGVSQGAVSRLEAGKGKATPFLLVLKIHLVFAAALRNLDAPLVNDALRRWLATVLAARLPTPTITPDAGLRQLLRLYVSVPEPRRPTLLSVAHSAAVALGRPSGTKSR